MKRRCVQAFSCTICRVLCQWAPGHTVVDRANRSLLQVIPVDSKECATDITELDLARSSTHYIASTYEIERVARVQAAILAGPTNVSL